MGSFATWHPGHCPFPMLCEYFMFQTPSINLFHGGYFIISKKNVRNIVDELKEFERVASSRTRQGFLRESLFEDKDFAIFY